MTGLCLPDSTAVFTTIFSFAAVIGPSDGGVRRCIWLRVDARAVFWAVFEQCPINLHLGDSGLVMLSAVLRQDLRQTLRTIETPPEE